MAALHFNENGHRNQAVTKAGELQWHISYPKGKKGEHVVVKPNKTPITYGMSTLVFKVKSCQKTICTKFKYIILDKMRNCSEVIK